MVKLQSDLSKLADAADDIVREALLTTAADIVNLSKQLAPVDTGALKESISADPVSSTRVLIGSDRDYSPFVEYGTSQSPAQPYLTPAFAQSVPTFQARLGEAIRRRANK